LKILTAIPNSSNVDINTLFPVLSQFKNIRIDAKFNNMFNLELNIFI